MHSPEITSRQHPLVKLLRTLHSVRGRRDSGLFAVEGRNAVTAALSAGWPLQEVLVGPGQPAIETLAIERSVPVRRGTHDVLQAASETASSLEAVAVGLRPPAQSLSVSGLLLVIDSVGDPGNMGTLLRAADAAGATNVVVTNGSADPWSPKVVRSAAGSLFYLPPVELVDRTPEALVQLLQELAVPIYTAEAHEGSNCYELAWPARCALVLGHETRGISAAFQQASTARVTIPVYGAAESLNVAMAGTLLMYAWRQAQLTN